MARTTGQKIEAEIKKSLRKKAGKTTTRSYTSNYPAQRIKDQRGPKQR